MVHSEHSTQVSVRIADNICDLHNQRGKRIMQEEFASIITGVVRITHNRTSDHQVTDNAAHVIIRAGKVLSAINRAFTMAVRFIDSDGQSSIGGAPDYPVAR